MSVKSTPIRIVNFEVIGKALSGDYTAVIRSCAHGIRDRYRSLHVTCFECIAVDSDGVLRKCLNIQLQVDVEVEAIERFIQFACKVLSEQFTVCRIYSPDGQQHTVSSRPR